MNEDIEKIINETMNELRFNDEQKKELNEYISKKIEENKPVEHSLTSDIIEDKQLSHFFIILTVKGAVKMKIYQVCSTCGAKTEYEDFDFSVVDNIDYICKINGCKLKADDYKYVMYFI